jgi:hypothetical protein
VLNCAVENLMPVEILNQWAATANAPVTDDIALLAGATERLLRDGHVLPYLDSMRGPDPVLMKTQDAINAVIDRTTGGAIAMRHSVPAPPPWSSWTPRPPGNVRLARGATSRWRRWFTR